MNQYSAQGFSVGQRVRIIVEGPYYGTVCTVLSPLFPARNAKLRIVKDGELVHELNIDGPGNTGMIATPDCLEPIDDCDAEIRAACLELAAEKHGDV